MVAAMADPYALLAPPTKNNLGREHTSFEGRAGDLAALDAWHAGGLPIVTILGPGGSGKTRLARRFGGSMLAAHSDAGGVWFCDLTEARSRGDVVAVVARTLGVPLTQG